MPGACLGPSTPSTPLRVQGWIRCGLSVALTLGFGLGLGFALEGCKREEAGFHDGVSADTIRLGSWGPLTGPQAAWGDSLRAMKAYLEHINVEGGIHGRKLELYVKDDGYDPSRTPAAARALVERDEVFAVVGAIGTANAKAAAPILERAGVPFFTPASGAAWLTSPEGPSNVRSVYLPYETEGRLIAEHLVTEMGLKSLAVIYQDDDFGREGLAGLEAGAKAAGGAVQASAPVTPTDTDVSGAVAAALEGEPDALVLYVAPMQAVLVGRKLAGRPERPQLVTSFVLNDPGIIARAGPEVWEGTLTAVVSRLADDENDPSVRQLQQILRRHAPSLYRGGFAMSGVRFIQPLLEALERAGPDLTREKLFTALESLDDYRGGGPHWDGPGLGTPVSFAGGQRLGVSRIGFARARDGRWVMEEDWREPTP